jgi:hypothetical protein
MIRRIQITTKAIKPQTTAIYQIGSFMHWDAVKQNWTPFATWQQSMPPLQVYSAQLILL